MKLRTTGFLVAVAALAVLASPPPSLAADKQIGVSFAFDTKDDDCRVGPLYYSYSIFFSSAAEVVSYVGINKRVCDGDGYTGSGEYGNSGNGDFEELSLYVSSTVSSDGITVPVVSASGTITVYGLFIAGRTFSFDVTWTADRPLQKVQGLVVGAVNPGTSSPADPVLMSPKLSYAWATVVATVDGRTPPLHGGVISTVP
jgi:hypothetical protein